METLQRAIDGLLLERDNAKKEVVALTARAEAFDARLTAERDAVKNLITKVEGDNGKVLHAAVALMQFDELDEMKVSYEKKLDKKFMATCQKCGSTSIERRSSLEQPVPVAGEAGGKDEKTIDERDYKVG